MIEELDKYWLRKHPLPSVEGGKGKEDRGQALVIGGSTFVPGAILLTGEAVLRAGAGKVQIGTVEEQCAALGIAFPEAAVIRLASDNGEISPKAIEALQRACTSCDVMIVGPGMIEQDYTSGLVADLLRKASDAPILLDAGAMTALRNVDDVAVGPLALTPHHGELATMLGVEKDEIECDPPAFARAAAARFRAVVALKSAETFVASPDGQMLRYVSPSPGLGTAGSGDVLAGVIGGLIARGADLFVAVCWGVWLHGEAGKAASARHGTTGYLARELLREVPTLLDAKI